MWSSVNDIMLYQSYLYCGMVNGLRIVDVSNPSAPTTVKEIFLNEDVRALDIQGTTLFVGSLYGGLLTFDISNPINPVQLGVLRNLPGRLFGLDASASLVVTASENRINFVDISNPSNPTLLQSLYYPPDSGFFDNSVLINDTLVYVAAAKLLIFDISDINNPRELTRFQTKAAAQSLALADSILLVGDDSGGGPVGNTFFTVVDISNPLSPSILGFYPIFGNLIGVTAAGGRAFASAGGSGIVEFDLSDLTNPIPTACHRWSGWATKTLLRDNYLYVNDLNCTWKQDAFVNTSICSDSQGTDIPVGSGGLEILDISTPGSPTTLSTTENFMHATKISNNADGFITVSDDEDGVTVLSPDSLLVYKSFKVIGAPQQSVTCNGALVVATAGSGLQIFDLSDSSNSAPIGTLSGFGVIDDVVTYGTTCYLGCDAGLRIIDLSNPNSPIDITPSTFQNSSFNLLIDANRLFVSNLSSTIKVFDLSNPVTPSLINTIAIPNGSLTSRMALSYNLLFTQSVSYTTITDITDIQNPAFIVRFSPGSAYGIAAKDSFFVTANDRSGVFIYNISKPDIPTLVSFLDTPGNSLNVTIKNHEILLADEYSVIRFALPNPTPVHSDEHSLPSTPLLLIAYPNPFNPSTQISFSLPRKCKVHLVAYNVLGQLVDTILDDELRAGAHLVSWNATGTKDRTHSSGSYFLHLTTSIGLEESTKVILVR